MTTCVPFTLHRLTGIPFEDMLDLARPYGWAPDSGMTCVAMWCLGTKLGLKLTPMRHPSSGTTLASMKKTLDPTKRYILFTKAHALAIDRGDVIDLAQTHGRSLVELYCEILEVETAGRHHANDEVSAGSGAAA